VTAVRYLKARMSAMATLTIRCIVSAALVTLAACNREAPPVYVPAPPPALASPEAPVSPAPATGEQLTIARACATDIERFCAGVPRSCRGVGGN
jgi:hypothetical protein